MRKQIHVTVRTPHKLILIISFFRVWNAISLIVNQIPVTEMPLIFWREWDQDSIPIFKDFQEQWPCSRYQLQKLLEDKA